MMKFINVSLCILCTNLCLSVPLISESLDNIIKKEKAKGSFEVDYQSMRDELDPQTVLGRLFLKKDTVPYLLQWVTTGYEEDEVRRVRTVDGKQEFVMVRGEIIRKPYSQVSASIIVPHPRFAPTVDLGIIIEIERLTPSTLEVTSKKESSFFELPTTLYTLKDKSCMAIVQLPKKAKAQFILRKCPDLGVLENFINKLTLDRLSRKLLS